MEYAALRRLLNPIINRLSLIVGRAVVKVISSESGEHQRLRLIALNAETISKIERIQDYGFESYPHEDSEAVGIFIGGNRDNGVVIVVGDRRYRPQDLSQGEAALYTDEDQLSGGHRIQLKRGQIIHLLGKIVTGIITSSVTITVPTFTVNGDMTATGDISDSAATTPTMAQMRTAYNAHTHPGGGGPNPTM